MSPNIRMLAETLDGVKAYLGNNQGFVDERLWTFREEFKREFGQGIERARAEQITGALLETPLKLYAELASYESMKQKSPL